MVLSTPDHVIEWYDCLMVLILINITTYLPFELHHSFLWAMRVWYEVVLRKWRTDLLWWRSGLLRFGPFISFYFLESRDAILMTFAVAYMLLNLVANSTPMVWTVYLTRNASTEHPILSLFITESRYIYIYWNTALQIVWTVRPHFSIFFYLSVWRTKIFKGRSATARWIRSHRKMNYYGMDLLKLQFVIRQLLFVEKGRRRWRGYRLIKYMHDQEVEKMAMETD